MMRYQRTALMSSRQSVKWPDRTAFDVPKSITINYKKKIAFRVKFFYIFSL